MCFGNYLLQDSEVENGKHLGFRLRDAVIDGLADRPDLQTHSSDRFYLFDFIQQFGESVNTDLDK